MNTIEVNQKHIDELSSKVKAAEEELKEKNKQVGKES